MKKLKKKLIPGVIWITGLSGSGKTTLSKMFYKYLKKNCYNNVKWLDGDQFRKKLKKSLKNEFSLKSRINLGKRYSKYASDYEKKGYLVVVSVIAMAEKIYKLNRKLIKNYHEIFLDVPLKELKKRDPKKIYYNFKIGKIRNVTGLDLKYDKPLYPEKIIKWNTIPKIIISFQVILFLLGIYTLIKQLLK